jgi:seryl-tRNA synthetase
MNIETIQSEIAAFREQLKYLEWNASQPLPAPSLEGEPDAIAASIIATAKDKFPASIEKQGIQDAIAHFQKEIATREAILTSLREKAKRQQLVSDLAEGDEKMRQLAAKLDKKRQEIAEIMQEVRAIAIDSRYTTAYSQLNYQPASVWHNNGVRQYSPPKNAECWWNTMTGTNPMLPVLTQLSDGRWGIGFKPSEDK